MAVDHALARARLAGPYFFFFTRLNNIRLPFSIKISEAPGGVQKSDGLEIVNSSPRHKPALEASNKISAEVRQRYVNSNEND